MYKVTSEIYAETDFHSVKSNEGQLVSKFPFHQPFEADELVTVTTDADGDLVVRRRQKLEIEIEHHQSTELKFVGLQVWRGALLLADYILQRRSDFKGKHILELGAGTGLTSISAAIVKASKVICTDVDIGGILDKIKKNVIRNRNLFSADVVQVLEYDFLQHPADYAPALLEAIDECDIVVAADIIYDDTLTDAFIQVIDYIFARSTALKKEKTIFVALEKRFVFTFAELDTVAPMFEYFLKQARTKSWHISYIPIDFPQYFMYERSQHLVLLKLTNSSSK